ncbi:hypothetical protein D3C87_825860 [compost metagenome]
MFSPTNTRMPASTASGTWRASGAASSTTTSSVTACTMPAIGELPPERMLVTVRAMVPVAGMPPKKGVTRLAMPCAISSWLGSWRGWPLTWSATRAHSSDSMAPSSAMVSVGVTSCLTVSHEKSGSAKAGTPSGMPPKRVPMVSTGSAKPHDTSVSDTSATIGPGMRPTICTGRVCTQRPPTRCTARASAESPRNSRDHASSPSTQASPSAKACGLKVSSRSAIACSCENTSAGMRSTVRPSRSFSCDSRISTAMPLVKPTTIDSGTKRTSRPSPNSPAMNSSTPAQAVAISRLATP